MSNSEPQHYETVAASQTDQVLGNAGAAGDFIDTLTCRVATAATSAVSIKDGTTSIAILPDNVGGGVGTYVLPVKLKSQRGAWSVTTNAGVSVIASGNFS